MWVSVFAEDQAFGDSFGGLRGIDQKKLIARSMDCAKLLPICTQALAAVLTRHSSLADLLVCNNVKQDLCCCYADRLYMCVQQFATSAI